MKPEERSKKTLTVVISIVGAFVIMIGILLVVRQFSMSQNNADTSQPLEFQNEGRHSTSPATNPGNGEQNNTQDNNAQTGEVQLEIKDFAYAPANITVKKGTKVTWVNRDDMRHDVTPDDEDKVGALAQSELLSKGQSYSFTFDTVGEFSYHCSPHPQMKGKVTVVE